MINPLGSLICTPIFHIGVPPPLPPYLIAVCQVNCWNFSVTQCTQHLSAEMIHIEYFFFIIYTVMTNKTWQNDLNKIFDKYKRHYIRSTRNSAVANIALEREDKKEKKRNCYNTGYWVFGAPGTPPHRAYFVERTRRSSVLVAL